MFETNQKGIFWNVSILIVLGVLISPLVVMGASWVNPTAVPTGGNTEAPINVSLTAQTKAGALVVQGNSSEFTQPLLVGDTGTNNNHAATKKYVDDQLSSFWSLKANGNIYSNNITVPPGDWAVVGIGTNNPATTTGLYLHVGGNAKIDGELELGGADVAEEFITQTVYEAGTVLVMGDNGYKSAKTSNKEYDTSVIGVVSDNASIVMGQVDSEKKAVVAMVGVVKVKINNSNGKIMKGDLLTTSFIEGEAMKAIDPKIGTIIGKSLEDSKGGNEIMALINLQ